MPQTVFWSWQSDRPGNVSRHFLRDVVVRAIAAAADDLGLEERPEIDHDVQGTAGIVSIPETILEKIDAAAVFVADITPVAQTADGKFVANPNVLIELGYAKKALGPERIILVWNGAWGGCTPEDLPFDLRHRRAPFLYTLGPDQPRAERDRAADRLVPGLAAAIAASLGRVPAPVPPAIERIPARADDPSAWFAANAEQIVNSGHSTGPETLVFREGPRAYLRIMPASWGPIPLAAVTDNRHDLLPLGDTMGMSWGRTRGGQIAYETDERRDGKALVSNAAQWFAATGEVWGIDGRATYGIDAAHAGLAVDYILQCWQRFLTRNASVFARYGVTGPVAFEAGVSGVDGLYWPKSSYDVAFYPAIEPTLMASRRYSAFDGAAINDFMRLAADATRHTFGFDPFGDEQLRWILADRRAQP